MTDRGIKRLPVVDADGVLLGIVTRTDLVRAFARTDPEIERDLRDTVLRMLWIEEPGLQLSVERGEVRLSGKIRRRTDAELLEAFAARVPGVVAVHSTLRWAWDDTKPRGTTHAFRTAPGVAEALRYPFARALRGASNP